MTEDDWLACTDPKPMLRFLIGDYPRVQDVEAFPDCKASDRKLRLFACACYYRIRRLLRSPLARATVEVAERFADGVSTLQELQDAIARLWKTLDALEGRWRASDGAEREALAPIYEARALALQCSRPEAPKAAWYASSNAYLTVAMIENPGGVGGWDLGFSRSQRTEERAQADVLRCLLDRLPFRPRRAGSPRCAPVERRRGGETGLCGL